jgi:hypothetical protein
MTVDGWTADNARIGYLGATAHWIHVDANTSKWSLQSGTVGFRSIFGTHDGKNLGRYLVGICDRMGLMSRTHSKVSCLVNFILHFI